MLAGEVEQYGELVRRYRARYAGYAIRLLGSPDAAEDAMQEAFIRAYDRLGQCRDPANFAGWFFMILRNFCYAEARERGRAHAPEREVMNHPARERADEALEVAELRRALARGLGALTVEQREVFVLKHGEGLGYEEIAERTGVAVAALKMRMHRAYDRLRAELEDAP